MEFSELIARRYSVRAYRPDPVEEEKLHFVLEAARLAPTACNLQPFKLIVVKTAGREAELNKIYRSHFFTQAPLIIGICNLRKESWIRRDGRNYVDVDAAIAMDHLILAAADQGLGTCWIAAFNVEEARRILNIPQEAEPLIFTPLGYPADDAGPKQRKSLSELVRYESW